MTAPKEEAAPLTLDVTEMPPAEWASVLARAALLGASDCRESRKRPRTTAEVRAALGIRVCRVGHERYLKRAYSAGWWHVDIEEFQGGTGW